MDSNAIKIFLCFPRKEAVTTSKLLSVLAKVILNHLKQFLCLINGAAPAEARYKLSGVMKLGVAVLRSFFKQDKTLENIFDNALIFRNIKVKDHECNKYIYFLDSFRSLISFAANLELTQHLNPFPKIAYSWALNSLGFLFSFANV